MQDWKQEVFERNPYMLAEYRAQRQGESLHRRIRIGMTLLCHYRILHREPPCFVYGEAEAWTYSGRQDTACLQMLLECFDLVSFDIFDTLLLRTCRKAMGVFEQIERERGWHGFAKARVHAERLAREQQRCQSDTSEVTLRQIYQHLPEFWRDTQAELYAEQAACFANPVFLPVIKKLRRDGIRIICLSDMYLPSDFLQLLINKAGYPQFEQVIVSCEAGCSKDQGNLFTRLSQAFPGKQIIHIGDNLYSDYIQARRHGISAVLYRPESPRRKGTVRYD